jgi:hypothetical protein
VPQGERQVRKRVIPCSFSVGTPLRVCTAVFLLHGMIIAVVD